MILGGPESAWFYNHFASEQPYTISVPNNSRISTMFAALENNSEIYTSAPLKHLTFLTSLLCEIISRETEKNGTLIPKYLLSIKQDYDENYSCYYSLDLLERDYKINKYRIIKEFSYHFGTSPINYLTAQRIKNAEMLLSSTNLKVNEIGQQVSYENTTHFINSFKKLTGMTPLSYRKNF